MTKLSPMLITAIAAVSAPHIQAASISWTPSFVIGSPSDISNPAGSSVHVAADFNTAAVDDGVINGITFTTTGANTRGIAGLFSTTFNSGPAYSATFTAASTGDLDLDALLDSHSWLGGNPGTANITLEGLTPGQLYQVQLIGVGDERGCCAGRVYEPDDGLGNFTTGVTVQRGLLQSTIGTFTADATTQAIGWRSLNDAAGNNDPGLSGITVLAVVPEPSTSLLAITGIALLVGRRRRR